MEGQLQSSAKLGSPIENEDVKYVSGLSTVLVAAIQEAKDRIAQIEYIFCNQLYPNFKSKSKLLRKIYSEAKRASDEEWKERDEALLIRAERLEFEKQRALEELARIEARQTRVDKLESDLRKKSNEVDEGLKLHGDLVQLLEMKLSAIVEKDKQLRENEERKNALEKKVKALQEAIRAKAEEVSKGNELTGNLLRKIESRDSEIANGENERRALSERLECSEEAVRQLRSLQKADCSEESEQEKKVLLEKVKKGADLYQRTLEEIESKTEELRTEKRKRKEVIEAYKRLKSQYNFLCSQSGLSKENMISSLKSQEDSDSFTNNQIPITSPDLEEQDQDTSPAPCDESKTKCKTIVNQTLDDEKRSQASTKNKGMALAGTKRLASSFWRDTRTHQGKNGQDPHDDFLDTPLENARGNIARAAAREDPTGDASDDDETQDVSDLQRKKNPMIVVAAKEGGGERGGFKYVETVRKKAEREILKGVECKQCKKFYDAVLCGEEGRDGNYAARCEHHEGVSRHRYKYVPPSTPEGFWNIGFESEM